MKLYLAFLGTQTIPVRADGVAAARLQVVGCRANREVAVRLARRSDAGWLRDAGALDLADELRGVQRPSRTSR